MTSGDRATQTSAPLAMKANHSNRDDWVSDSAPRATSRTTIAAAAQTTP